MRIHSAFCPLLLAVAGCGASPAYEPEIPPPPPHVPVDAVPPPPAAPGEVVIGADTDAGVPAAPAASGPLPDLPSQAPIYAEAPAAPPPSQRTVVYSSGQWVYADGYGWMWVPNDAGRVVVEQVPYAYLYTPGWGWNWYVSPWGYGPYAYGGWVTRPYHPVGWRYGWVAPRHVTVRIGGGYRGGGYRGGGYRGGGVHGGHHR